ncbi:hypothetical protein [Pseudogulbenkiania ferrooxidans]|uniref:Uncharacterized protein n=1 Tax=Pseudogulbenkiania ferrooxidans EGD-HP2 TaxID=1388764 RepID=A0ABP2XP82_9NEIS|nr:hypothetical protein [Pseudogulbenkiania ferrooxidans]ERE10040.1 hypothetical protein O166_05525 [Pseudogulbenkiania ferrooxidans EGD-HP2]
MEFTEIAAILGAITSLVSVAVSFRLTSNRIKAEKELANLFHEKLTEDKKLHEKTVRIIKRKPNVQIMNSELLEYEKVLLSLLEKLSEDDRARIYPAIKQPSPQGRISYISKLISSEAKSSSAPAAAP